MGQAVSYLSWVVMRRCTKCGSRKIDGMCPHCYLLDFDWVSFEEDSYQVLHYPDSTVQMAESPTSTNQIQLSPRQSSNQHEPPFQTVSEFLAESPREHQQPEAKAHPLARTEGQFQVWEERCE